MSDGGLCGGSCLKSVGRIVWVGWIHPAIAAARHLYTVLSQVLCTSAASDGTLMGLAQFRIGVAFRQFAYEEI